MIGFGKYGKKRELGIVSTDDARLVLIDSTSEGFFANVLGYVAEDEKLKDFIEAIKEVKEAGVGPFWKPIYDPSLDGEEVVFKAGSTPAVEHSYNFWKQKAEKMPTVPIVRKWHSSMRFWNNLAYRRMWWHYYLLPMRLQVRCSMP